jgi:hypothetical protein
MFDKSLIVNKSSYGGVGLAPQRPAGQDCVHHARRDAAYEMGLIAGFIRVKYILMKPPTPLY